MPSDPPIVQAPDPPFRMIALPDVTPGECDALLAGLRVLQWVLDLTPSPDSLPDSLHDLLVNGGSALTSDELDHLCHRLTRA